MKNKFEALIIICQSCLIAHFLDLVFLDDPGELIILKGHLVLVFSLNKVESGICKQIHSGSAIPRYNRQVVYILLKY